MQTLRKRKKKRNSHPVRQIPKCHRERKEEIKMHAMENDFDF